LFGRRGRAVLRLRSAKPADNRAKVDALIAPYVCLPFDEAAADHFAVIRLHLETLGTPIGPYDLQIAAIARANSCTLVTHNAAEFGRVPGLPLEDWEVPMTPTAMAHLKARIVRMLREVVG
jgi:tRNA(fMet)-specific endonuclease VapC